MRATVRSKLIKGALAKRIPVASLTIYSLLDQQFLEVLKEVQSNRLRKSTLEKFEWPNWISSLAEGIKNALTDVVGDVSQIESDYWDSRGVELKSVNVQDVFDAYQARLGRQISEIGDTTREKTLEAITNWYNEPDVDYDSLISKLQQWYSQDRADSIARTEAGFLSSQVTLDTMDEIGIEKWAVDIGPNTCTSTCIPIAESGPYDLDAETPPFHTRCDCGMIYVEEVNKFWQGISLVKEFVEAEHPRGHGGKFAPKGGIAVPSFLAGPEHQEKNPGELKPVPLVGEREVKPPEPDEATRMELKGGGSYYELRKEAVAGQEVHHMPADTTSPLKTPYGPAIVMSKEDHFQTASYMSTRDAIRYRKEQSRLISIGRFDKAQQMDIDDLHEKFGSKYDSQIKAMKEYTAKLQMDENRIPKNPPPRIRKAK